MLARALSGARNCPSSFARLSRALTARDAFWRFVVECLRAGCAAPPLANGFNNDVSFVPALTDPQYIARSDLPRDFDALAPQLHFAALDRIFGQCSRFEKTCCPKPLVDADLIRFVWCFSQLLADR